MKKVKIVVSDFHLSKGRRLPDGSVNELEEFTETDKFLELVEHYSTGEYADADVELIANGDFFDLLSVDHNRNYTERITEQLSVEKMHLIIRGHNRLFEGLAAFCAGPNKHLTFIVGNHDAGLLWERVQEVIKRRISPSVRFFEESYDFDGVFVTHGHQYEFLMHVNPRDFYYVNAEGEKILRLPWGGYFVVNVVARHRAAHPEIARIRPFGKYLRWTFLHQHIYFWRIIWNLVYFWARNRFHPDPDRRREFYLSPLRMRDAMTHQSMLQTVEEILVNTSYRIVIVGHSHRPGYWNFGIHGELFNTGTWTEVMDLDLAKFGRRKERTYALIEYDEQGPRASLYNWYGETRMVERVA